MKKRKRRWGRRKDVLGSSGSSGWTEGGEGGESVERGKRGERAWREGRGWRDSGERVEIWLLSSLSKCAEMKKEARGGSAARHWRVEAR
eukprot:scaffold55932_cov30-Tisochrysis_lutea.AAC.1